MSRPVYLKKDSYQRLRWKNGVGYTDQIAIEPAQADLRLGDYLWRISSASIESSSDFSLFPGHDRILVVIQGAGVRLFHRDLGHEFNDSVDVEPFEPYEFPGDIPSRCELIDGPVRDLSVFHKKGEISASVDVIHLDGEATWDWTPQGQWSFLFAARGRFEVAVTETGVQSLDTGESLRSDLDSSCYSESFPVAAHSPGSILLSIAIWRT